ncbi:hypothetical protein NDU88_000792 [Pleurodeles waltl]|uniref:Uncharacterized protein n=1 Tax=Pleurodeles waltl TaxID=8319 RepID=A0AAV7TG14_PLEWA|nr:hypothetical protein NDU88_000792 [Pleurodeles waltl]
MRGAPWAAAAARTMRRALGLGPDGARAVCWSGAGPTGPVTVPGCPDLEKTRAPAKQQLSKVGDQRVPPHAQEGGWPPPPRFSSSGRGSTRRGDGLLKNPPQTAGRGKWLAFRLGPLWRDLCGGAGPGGLIGLPGRWPETPALLK